MKTKIAKKSSIVSNFIKFKKRSGLFKKKNKLKYYLLVKLNSFKHYKNLNNINRNPFTSSRIVKKKSSILPKDFDVNKFLELKRKTFKLFNLNRNIIKDFFRIKKSRQFQLTKIFSKTLKVRFFNFLMDFELSIYNLLIRSKLAFSFNESLFFLKNGFILINGITTYNQYKVLNLGDVVSLNVSKKFYKFYLSNFNNKLKMTFSLGYRL
jgi:hypothetical protein